MEKPIEEFAWDKRSLSHTCHPCALVKFREHHYATWAETYRKHKETRKERSKTYYREIKKPKNMRLYGTAKSLEDKARVAKYATDNKKKYGTNITPEALKRASERYSRLRATALGLYGGKCECCGESRFDMLTFDHKIHTYYKNKIKGVKLVYEVIREYHESGYPNDKYRVLCWNCNTSLGYYGYCPHDGGADITRDINLLTASWSSKMEMIAAYGNSCAVCGESNPEFLTIDHINGGGTQHRKVVGTGMAFRKWLKLNGWPKNDYRLLCANCNCSQKRNKWTARQSKGGQVA